MYLCVREPSQRLSHWPPKYLRQMTPGQVRILKCSNHGESPDPQIGPRTHEMDSTDHQSCLLDPFNSFKPFKVGPPLTTKWSKAYEPTKLGFSEILSKEPRRVWESPDTLMNPQTAFKWQVIKYIWTILRLETHPRRWPIEPRPPEPNASTDHFYLLLGYSPIRGTTDFEWGQEFILEPPDCC